MSLWPMQVEDFSRCITGKWLRGRARVTCIPKDDAGNFLILGPRLEPTGTLQGAVKVVEFVSASAGLRQDEPASWQGVYPYVMEEGARGASQALTVLLEEHGDAGIEIFVLQYGCLVNFLHLVADATRFASGFKFNVRRREWEVDDRGMVLVAILSDLKCASPYSEMGDFFQWCEAQGEQETLEYLVWATCGLQNYPDRLPSLLPEPVAFYRWAAQRLARLSKEMKAGKLSEDTAQWLQDRSVHLSPSFVDPIDSSLRKVALYADDLLSYLTMEVVFDAIGARPELRVCQECGSPFELRHGRQRFCCTRCQERHKHRRLRRKAQQQREDEVKHG